ncbi:phytoene desaturase [Halomicroarcula sp. F13]|uniref:Phytoene desaturase n=1 Tax=Haloarcula rubra TaxID=2487747 RepID=A0AAW4PNU5_9EURY|nr:phytoene desaturase family protein [Halomicroarcula rubra]MBX0322411.1 phytoene desaturase [Halomicroarcula rubra]
MTPTQTPTTRTPLAGRTATVVGAGFGGLATACYLADAGADVAVLERHERPGGHANRIEDGRFAFDTGPSWYLMPDVFERFFGHFGRAPSDYYDLVQLDPHYRVVWKEGDESDVCDSVDVRPDMRHNRAVFESYEDGAGEALERYLEEAEHTYEVGMERFVYEDRQRLRDFLDVDVLRSARGLTFLGSMQDHVADYFDHPKLRQLLQYTLVFLGGSPYNTPALYNLMSHVDFELGVYYPEGGLYSVVEGLVALAEELGVSVRTDCEVSGLARASDGVTVVTGDGVETRDVVVANANLAHVDRDLLPEGTREYREGYWDDRTYAPSAYMLYLGVEGSVDPLEHHTLLLPEDWEPHFESIFEDPRWPEDPSYYVNVPSVTDDSVAPAGHETVVVLVPVAPGLDDDEGTRGWFRERVLSDLATHTGVDLRDRIVVEQEACVSEFAERYDDPQGTALGLAHTLRQTGPLRPGHRSSALDGLYYTGSFTTPGVGVPMCLISGQHAADAVVADH